MIHCESWMALLQINELTIQLILIRYDRSIFNLYITYFRFIFFHTRKIKIYVYEILYLDPLFTTVLLNSCNCSKNCAIVSSRIEPLFITIQVNEWAFIE